MLNNAQAALGAPFKVRSFRFQWSADLVMSWAVEMEVLVLGWYILIESGSVTMLVIFGALQYAGSLASPVFGVVSDRCGYRKVFLITRGAYSFLAVVVMVLAGFSLLSPMLVLVLAGISGIVRPSDNMMRFALVGQTIPLGQLTAALAISRMTADTARIAGALVGVGAVAYFGITTAYAAIALLYFLSFLFSLGLADKESDLGSEAFGSASGELWAAFEYVWTRPALLGAMTLAFLVNFFAYPFTLGLLPYIAKDVFAVEQGGLGALSASFALGALLGSLVLGLNRFALGTARAMLVNAALWFVMLLVFSLQTDFGMGMFVLVCVGCVSSLSMTPLASVMLRETDAAFRGRVMSMRMLAIWGLPAGLLVAGPLIDLVGYRAMAFTYIGLGLLMTLGVAVRWHKVLWNKAAFSNQHR